MIEHNVEEAIWSANVLACLPPVDETIDDEEVARRKDLRHLGVCSIDPPGCKDIDDALHFRHLENGNVEIGVHIADVAHYVKVSIFALSFTLFIYLSISFIYVSPDILIFFIKVL